MVADRDQSTRAHHVRVRRGARRHRRPPGRGPRAARAVRAVGAPEPDLVARHERGDLARCKFLSPSPTTTYADRAWLWASMQAAADAMARRMRRGKEVQR